MQQVRQDVAVPTAGAPAELIKTGAPASLRQLLDI